MGFIAEISVAFCKMNEILMLLHGKEPVVFKKIGLCKKIVNKLEIFKAELCLHDHIAEQRMKTPQTIN
jgi:hypothetical protein